MANVRARILTDWATSALVGSSARRDVLVVCPDAAQRDTYRAIFERRGLTAIPVTDCRVGIEASFRCHAVLAVIVGEPEDHYAGPLINALRSCDPKADVWLIGNPFGLRLSEIVLRHQVAVLPEATTPDQFERVVFI